jgi:hypothetical protein
MLVMKRLFYLLTLALVLPVVFNSCDDDDLPDVKIHVNFEGASLYNDTLFVAQGDTLNIKSITVENQEKGKTAALGGATYYWDYVFLGNNPFEPYNFSIAISDEMLIGSYLLQIVCPVYAEDKAAAEAVIAYPVHVLTPTDSIPSGSSAVTIRPDLKAD